MLDVMAGMNSIAAIVAVLGLCLMFHETGHFLVAKLARMRVYEFALGFGPSLLSFERAGTKYGLRIIPFGAFVRIAGMEPGEAQMEGGFHSRPRWSGALVILAGPCMNVVLAVLLFTFVAMVQGVPVKGDRGLLVNSVMRESAAAEAGLKEGDKITALDGARESLTVATVLPDSPAAKAQIGPHLRVLQVGDTSVSVPGDLVALLSQAKTEATLKCADTAAQNLSDMAKVIALPTAGFPAPKAGSSGASEPQDASTYCRDVLGVTFEGLDNEAVVGYVSDRAGKPVQLTVLRAGQEVPLTVTPKVTWERTAAISATGQLDAPHKQVGRIGVILGGEREPVSFRQAALMGTVGSLESLIQAVQTFQAMARGRVSMKSVSGPVGIMAMSAETAKKGWSEVLSLCGMISVSLAVINLLPIPPFDGFHIVLLGYEGIIRRRIDAKKQLVLTVGGFILVCSLLILVTAKDVTNSILYGGKP